MVGAYLETARLLGQRTGELHLALCSVSDDPDFAPEPFTALYQRALYQSMRNLTTRTFDLLREHLGELPGDVASQARRVLERESRILEIFRGLIGRKMTATRARCHGDYHLGQVLYTGRDFVIIDFEGEPARPLTERRLKRSPLRDVAGMLRSFQYAACTVLHGSSIRPEDVPVLEPWARFWQLWVSSAFLRAYLRATQDSPVVPRSRAELQLLLDVLLLEKAIYELGYEVNHRPAWVRVPLQGILELVK
jgi:maltose alpha-D-glucosyltransferase/alpha-amylase